MINQDTFLSLKAQAANHGLDTAIALVGNSVHFSQLHEGTYRDVFNGPATEAQAFLDGLELRAEPSNWFTRPITGHDIADLLDRDGYEHLAPSTLPKFIGRMGGFIRLAGDGEQLLEVCPEYHDNAKALMMEWCLDWVREGHEADAEIAANAGGVDHE